MDHMSRPFTQSGYAVWLHQTGYRDVYGLAGDQAGSVENYQDRFRDQPACIIETRRDPSREATQEHRDNPKQHHCGGQRYNDEVREDCDQRNVMLLKNQDRERSAPADDREAE